MGMDQNQMLREREMYKLIQEQQAMQQLKQMQLGQSMQEPQAPAPAEQQSTDMQPQMGSSQDMTGATQTPTTGGGANLSDFHEQATQTALGLLGYLNHLIPRNDLGEPVKADAIHTVAQAIAQLIGLQQTQTDIAPQDKLNLEMQKMQAEHQMKAVDMAHQHQLEQAKMQMEQQKMQQQMALEQQKAQAEHQHQQESHQQTLAMNADNHQFNQKLQTAKLALAKETADKQSQQQAKQSKTPAK